MPYGGYLMFKTAQQISFVVSSIEPARSMNVSGTSNVSIAFNNRIKESSVNNLTAFLTCGSKINSIDLTHKTDI